MAADPARCGRRRHRGGAEPRVRPAGPLRHLGRHARPRPRPGRGDERAALALDVFTHHCRRGIAEMAASLDRLDALVLTGEIGEDQPEVREEVCAGLPVLGLTGGLRPVVTERPEIVSEPGARVPVVVVPTGEAQQVDRETRALLAGRTEAADGGRSG
ncbi:MULTISPECIES: hypothetical protein [Streptomyces]|uniref:hypothetical protein n=1 Tax=Streptomyces TaxID=1883 RepID=UPI00227D8BC7|nr:MULTISPECIES: hypothetical protein [Streptomyces]MDX2982238.1 hypothetical protein [Streptomyces sp. NRRL_B-2249]